MKRSKYVLLAMNLCVLSTLSACVGDPVSSDAPTVTATNETLGTNPNEQTEVDTEATGTIGDTVNNPAPADDPGAATTPDAGNDNNDAEATGTIGDTVNNPAPADDPGAATTPDAGNDNNNSPPPYFRIAGDIWSFVSVSEFKIEEIMIDAGVDNVRFDDGSVEDLRDGVCVEVRGDLIDRPAGTTLVAQRIRFDDSDCR